MWLLYIFVFSWSIYLIWTGARTIMNSEYRNYITNVWFRSDNTKQETGRRLSVKYVGGPLYILFGLMFFVYGIWQLDVDYGILDKMTIVRSFINSVVQ
jgi:hypothetical protein